MMARPLRLEFNGAIYHLTSRGNAREDILTKMATANARIVHAGDRYGYSQRKVADFLDLHYATVSRLGKQVWLQET